MIELTPEQWTELLNTLALPADTDAETLLAAVSDLVATPADPAVAASVLAAAGMAAIDTATLDALRTEAEQGRHAVAAAEAARIDAVVLDALTQGKIPPARREHWSKLIAADPGMEQVLASTPAGLAVNVTERGYGHHNDDDGVIEPAAWFR